MSRRKLKADPSTVAPAPLVLDNHEPSAWLRQATAALLATLPATPGWTAVVPLGGHTVAGSREDRSCDRCGLYVPPNQGNIYPGRMDHRRRDGNGSVVVVFGLCRTCADSEVPGWGELR